MWAWPCDCQCALAGGLPLWLDSRATPACSGHAAQGLGRTTLAAHGIHLSVWILVIYIFLERYPFHLNFQMYWHTVVVLSITLKSLDCCIETSLSFVMLCLCFCLYNSELLEACLFLSVFQRNSSWFLSILFIRHSNLLTFQVIYTNLYFVFFHVFLCFFICQVICNCILNMFNTMQLWVLFKFYGERWYFCFS